MTPTHTVSSLPAKVNRMKGNSFDECMDRLTSKGKAPAYTLPPARLTECLVPPFTIALLITLVLYLIHYYYHLI